MIDAEDLRCFAARSLAAVGLPGAAARRVAAAMLEADLLGVHSHGVAKLLTYLDRVDAGVLEVDPEMRWCHERGATALLDAANGFGQVAASLAMERAIELAAEHGIGAVSVARSNHFGIAGHYARIAAAQGCIGIAMTNASPAMPAFGGAEPLLGTNPLAIGVPGTGRADAVLDMSATTVARGRIRRAVEQGVERLPKDWATDAQGRPTGDPRAALEGNLLPVGGPKGAGLALMIELLTGALSGTGVVGEVTGLPDASRPSGTAHLLLAIDPAAFAEESLELVGRSLDAVVASRPQGDAPVQYPGMPEQASVDRAGMEGVDLAPSDLRRLDAVAERLGLAPLAR